jgi:hypothetical protein
MENLLRNGREIFQRSINIPQSSSKTSCKTCQVGPTALLPRQRSCAADFVVLKTPLSSAEFEPANFESIGKHDNH